MKKFFIYLLIILMFVGGKAHDINTKNKAMFEARKEIEQEKEQKQKEDSEIYWDEFNQQYIIEIDGNAYTFTENQIKYINEVDDLEELKPIYKKIVLGGV